MTNKQKISLRVSAVRQRLNAISGLEGEAFTDEIRGEAGALQSEYNDLETRHRAAVISEGDEENRMAGQFGGGDGESAERRALLGRVHVSDYLTRAAAGTGIDGGAAELNAAFKVPATGPSGGVAIPWIVLAGPQAEHRAFTETRT